MRSLVLVLSSILMGAVGQILLKVGANAMGSLPPGLQGLLSILKSGYIWLGLVLFGTSFFCG